MPLCSLEEGLEELKAGRFLIVVDDENRENEGDLVMPAEMVTAEAVNFVVTHARGLLCMPIIGERLDELQIPLMVSQNGSEKNQTAFTVSVDYNVNTTTGISAGDRAATILAMLDPKTKPISLPPFCRQALMRFAASRMSPESVSATVLFNSALE